MNTLNHYAKCIAAALVTGYGTYQVARAGGVITQAEWIQIGLAILASLGAVWGVPNALAPVTTPKVSPVDTIAVVNVPVVQRAPEANTPVVVGDAVPVVAGPPTMLSSNTNTPVDLAASVQAGL